MAAATRRKWLSNRLLAAILVIVSVIALIPAVISYAIQQWLQGQGLQETYLLDVDFNPFLGRLRLEDLKARKADTPPLEIRLAEVDMDWWPLTRHQASIRTLRFEGVDLTLIQQGKALSISGIPLPGPAPETEDAPPGQPWGFGIDRLEISDTRIGFQLPDFAQTITIEKIALDDLRSWDADNPARVSLLLHLNDSSIALDLGVRSFALTRTVDGTLRIEGLDLASLAHDLKALLPEQLAISTAHLGMDADIELRLSKEDISFRQKGTVSLQDADLQYEDQHLQLGTVSWNGEFGWSRKTGAEASGDLDLSAIMLTAPARKLQLASLAGLRIDGLRLDAGQQISLASLALTKPSLLSAAETQQPLFNASALQLGASRYQDGRLELGSIDIQDAQLSLMLDENGIPAPLARLQADTSGDTTPAPTADTEQAGKGEPQIRVAGLRLSGQSHLSIRDPGVTPVFEQRLELKTLTIGPVDSASAESTPFELAGRIGEYSDLHLTGTARPLADKLSLSVDGDIKAVDLPPLSSYTARTLGYNLRSGQLDAKLQLKVVEDQLDSVAELTLNKLTVKPADPEKYGQMAAELAMPLDSALNMLRDSDDNIRIKLPVTGDIHSPDFDLSNIINKAIGKALKNAALTYVKFALQPYGTLLTLAQRAGKQAQQALLKPIDFAADSATFGADNTPYLGKLAGLLQERPQMRITICGIVTEEDRQARIAQAEASRQRELEQQAKAGAPKPAQLPAIVVSDEQLLPLAKARSEAVKRSLVELGIAPERLFLCNPELDTNAEAAPRVDLLL